MSNQVDVLVIGGGPAGLAAAIAARQKGFRVTVADGAAPPIDKACGEGMMPESLAALKTLGVSIAAHEGFRFRGIRFIHRGSPGLSASSPTFRSTANLACPADPAPRSLEVTSELPQGFGLGLRRPLLHEKLVASAEQCGVQLLWRSPVSAMDAQGVTVQGRRIAARWTVGADGQGSRVRKWSGLDKARASAQRFANRRHYRVTPWSDFMQIYWGDHVQAYVTPIGREEICVVLIGEQIADVKFDRGLQELPALSERLRGAELASRERGALTFSKSLKNVQRGNVALVGDASGSVDAITGEGLRLAFRQAFALADAMEAGDLASYQRQHRVLEKRPMIMARLMLFLGRHPELRNRVLNSFTAQPELLAKLLAFHVGEATPAQFLSAGAALGWRLLAV
jgi:flavin-dependent dehydrogenase